MHNKLSAPINIAGVKDVIAVASGKGGVGKSTTSVNLAYGLKYLGYKVGLLDADIYGPSLPSLLGFNKKPEIIDFKGQKKIKPINHHDVLTMSMGFMVEQDAAIAWRGLMVQKTIKQFFYDVSWDIDGPLDILIIDLPPGTGDVQLTMLQKINLSGAIIVSTPQDLALVDAKRAYQMFQITKTPILGLIDNMNHLTCPHCENTINVFGKDAIENYTKESSINILARIPLSLKIREASDQGLPVVLENPLSSDSKIYIDLANKVKDTLYAV